MMRTTPEMAPPLETSAPPSSGCLKFYALKSAKNINCAGWVDIEIPVVTKVLAAVRTLDRFGISDREGAAIVSAALQDVGIISESNVLNVVDRNKIRRGRTKAKTTLLSQVIKDYDHDQFGLYFDGRKGKTLSMEDNRRKVVKEEHISLVKETGSENIGHVSVNFGRAQIIGNNRYSFLSCVDNAIDVTKLVATEHLTTQVSKE
ncbi:hypothetical protein AVEN_228050-1, partial [Araneus ventricosus]